MVVAYNLRLSILLGDSQVLKVLQQRLKRAAELSAEAAAEIDPEKNI
jgi:hypothetical protein